MSWIAVFGMGLVLGMLGGGGGILTVPILVGLFGFTATAASGASLLVVGCASAVGATQGILAKQVQVTKGLMVAIPSMLGAVAARAWLVPSLPANILGVTKDEALLLAFASLMVYIGTRFLRQKKEESNKNLPAWATPILGFGIGLVSGLLGAGGGFLILPLLTLVLGLEMEVAIPTSLFVISIQSLGGFLPELAKPVRWSILLPIIGISLLGMLIGTLVRKRIPKRNLQLGFAFLVLTVAAWLIFRVAMNHF